MVFQEGVPSEQEIKSYASNTKSKSRDFGAEIGIISQELNSLSRRSRVLEERYTNTRRKMQVTDQNMLNNNKKLQTEVGAINDELREMKLEFEEFKNKMKMMISEIRSAARKEDVDIVKRYLEYWQPLNFVMHEEIEGIVKDIIEKNYKNK
jgi:chromosome segregation ATPase